MEFPLQPSATVYSAAEKRSDTLIETLDALIGVLDETITRLSRLEQTLDRLEYPVTR